MEPDLSITSPVSPAQTERPNIGWGWRDVGLALVVFFIGGALLVLGGRWLVGLLNLPPSGSLLSPVAYVVGVGLYLALILGIYLFAARRAGWAALGLRRTSWLNVALVLPLFLLGLVGLVLVNTLIGQLVGSFENPQVDAITGGQALTPTELLAGLLLVAGLVPFAEELFFRGMLYPLLRGRAPAVVAVLANAGLFAIAHVIPLLIPGLFVVGMLLAYLRERSGSIWPSVLFHAMQNSLALLLINAALSAGLAP